MNPRSLPALLVLLVLPLAIASDCAPPPVFYGYRFLNPRVVDYETRLAPFFAHFGQVYRNELDQPANVRRRDNVAEWHERFCGQATADDIEALVYGNNFNNLERMSRTLQRAAAQRPPERVTTADVPSGLRGNSFAEHLLTANCHEVVDYLLYAKRVEPYVVRPPRPFEPTHGRRSREMKDLLDAGLNVFLGLESHYVRLRYAYQLIRLAHYLGEHAYVLELYDYLMPKIEADPSILYDWTEAHRAGALQRLGNYAESAYLFSRVFDRCPSLREEAYRSFRIQTDEQWRAASLLCQNDHERAMLHVLRAHNGRAVVLEEVRSIYLLEPDNRSLPLLVLRELRELERDLLGLDFNPRAAQNRRRLARPRPGATDRLVAFQEFVDGVLDDARVTNRDFWLLADGVLEMLAGDYFFAREAFAKLRRNSRNDTILAQVAVLSQVTNLLALGTVNDSVEIYYHNLLESDLRRRHPDLRPLVNDKFEALYRRNGQQAKAALMQYGIDAIQKNPTIGYIAELRRIADSTNLNPFDRELLANRMGPHPEDDIQDLLGNHHLQQGQWEIALDYYRQIPTVRRDDYGRFSPFLKQFRDRVNYRPDRQTNAAYNKVELLERIFELEDVARRTTNDTLAAENYFSIGLAFYNLSYFGYAWAIADYFRSGTSAALATRRYYPFYTFPHPEAPLGNRENMSMRLAQDYFERALLRAPDREMAAQLTYFLAKAERNEYFANGRPGGRRPLRYLSLLRDEYADTRYYRRVVEECSTFAWFVGR